MDALIYQQKKSAMQSGKARSGNWILEFVQNGQSRKSDPLMGWPSSGDTLSQVKLSFQTRNDAISFAKRENLSFTVEPETVTKRLVKSYGDNFAANRVQPWTH